MLLSGNQQVELSYRVKLGRQRLRKKIQWEVGTEKSRSVEGREGYNYSPPGKRRWACSHLQA